MKTIETANAIYFDVDGTLIRDAYDGEEVCAFPVPHPYRGNAQVWKVKMHRNIDLLKDMSTRGRIIVVWSQAGYQWADAVVRALDLQNFVDLVIEKPIAYVDDLESQEFMGQRIFLRD